MSNIQKTLDSLQPYVIGIRYLEGTVVVDAVFKEGWSMIEDPNITKVKGTDEINYYMLYSEKEHIGLDELLNYVERVIKVNQERERKHELLKEKVNELKEIFKKNTLAKLVNLRFVFKEEELVPSLNDFDVDDIDTDLEPAPQQEPIAQKTNVVPVEQPKVETKQPPAQPQTYLDEDGKPIQLTEEEREMLEEEARAERNRKALEQKKVNKPTPANGMVKKVELPPKKKPELAYTERDVETDCDCGPDEACDKCIDQKGF